MTQDLLAITSFVLESIWHILPAFALSVFIGVLIRALKLDGVIRRAFSSRMALSIVLATAVGAFSPFCSCTVVPVIAAMLISGVPLPPVMAFWVASPTMDPEIFALSVGTLGWQLALIRLGGALLLSLGAGYLTLLVQRLGLLPANLLRPKIDAAHPARTATPDPIPAPAFISAATLMPAAALAGTGGSPALTAAPAVSGVACATCQEAKPSVSAGWIATLRGLDWRAVGGDTALEAWQLGRWLVLAFLMEALIIKYVPQEAIASLLGGGNGFAVPLAALLGVPLYLSNISALPIVAGLLAQGMQAGAAIAFLMAGPVTTMPAMTAVWGLVKPRVFLLYLLISLLGAVGIGLAVNLLLI